MKKTPQVHLKTMTRRSYLKGTFVIFGTIKAGSLLSAFAPSHSYAIELQNITEQEYTNFLGLIKTMFPQQRFSDQVYELSIKDFDNKMSADENTNTLIKNGLQGLSDIAFNDKTQEDKLSYLNEIKDDAFFNTIRANCIVSLYSNPLAFEALGYEGESFSQAGYLNNGFQDIKWLPDPPEEASPAV